MKVGDLVKIKWASRTSREKIGVVLEFIRFNGSEYARVFHNTGDTGTYRSSNLEAVK